MISRPPAPGTYTVEGSDLCITIIDVLDHNEIGFHCYAVLTHKRLNYVYEHKIYTLKYANMNNWIGIDPLKYTDMNTWPK